MEALRELFEASRGPMIHLEVGLEALEARYSLCCQSYCDVIILHRRPFLNLAPRFRALSRLIS